MNAHRTSKTLNAQFAVLIHPLAKRRFAVDCVLNLRRMNLRLAPQRIARRQKKPNHSNDHQPPQTGTLRGFVNRCFLGGSSEHAVPNRETFSVFFQVVQLYVCAADKASANSPEMRDFFERRAIVTNWLSISKLTDNSDVLQTPFMIESAFEMTLPLVRDAPHPFLHSANRTLIDHR